MSTSRGILLRPITLPLGNVGDVTLAEERQQVMLAQTVEVDVLDDHHLVIIDREQRVVEHRVDVGGVAARQKAQRCSTRFGVSSSPSRDGSSPSSARSCRMMSCILVFYLVVFSVQAGATRDVIGGGPIASVL